MRLVLHSLAGARITRGVGAASLCERTATPISLVHDDGGQCDGGIVLGRQVGPGSRSPPFIFFLIHLAGLSVVCSSAVLQVLFMFLAD